MTGNNKNLSILTLDANCLNAPIKRHRIANCTKKQDPTICCLEEINLAIKKNEYWLRVRSGKKFSKQMDPINKQE
jgi:hypothetical protein